MTKCTPWSKNGRLRLKLMLIKAFIDVKTTDGYLLSLFHVGCKKLA